MVLTLGILLLLPAKPTFAITTEEESNDTLETATPVDRCTLEPEDVVNRNSTPANAMYGGGTSGDEDWYSTTLEADSDNYFSFTCNSGLYSICLYDSDGILDENNMYDTVYSSGTYDFEVAETGTYYIQISCSSSGTYNFSIGNVLYRVASYQYSGESLSLTKGETLTDTFNLSENTEIPEGAIIYQVSLSGGSSTTTSKRGIKPTEGSTWLTTSITPWKITVDVSSNYLLKQSWDVEYIAKKTVTISPVDTFYYIYPLLPDTSWDLIY